MVWGNLDFVVTLDLTIVNSLFKKEYHLGTFRSAITKTQIDLFLIRANKRRMCKDCKVILSECMGAQHRLLVMDLMITHIKLKKRSVGDDRI